MKTTTPQELRDIMGLNQKPKKRKRGPKSISMFGEEVPTKPKAKRKKLAFVDDTPRATHTLTEPVSLYIPGDPQPWTAPEFTSNGGAHGHRTEKLQKWYSRVVPILMEQWLPRPPIGHAVSYSVLFVFPRSKIPAPLRETWPKERAWMPTSCDLSNNIKSLEDSLSCGRGCKMAGVWVDDVLVVEISSARKVIAAEGEDSGIYITIRHAGVFQ